MNTSGIPCRCTSDGGPAFPFDERHGDGTHYQSHAGMSLRDYFAAKAMHQMLRGAVLPVGYDATEDLNILAGRAYETADAMLRARATTGETL